MPKSADEQVIADEMYRYFNREWRDKIQAALRQLPRTDTAQNTIANLLTDAYLCGVRDGGGFGMRSLAQEMRTEAERRERSEMLRGVQIGDGNVQSNTFG